MGLIAMYKALSEAVGGSVQRNFGENQPADALSH